MKMISVLSSMTPVQQHGSCGVTESSLEPVHPHGGRGDAHDLMATGDEKRHKRCSSMCCMSDSHEAY